MPEIYHPRISDPPVPDQWQSAPWQMLFEQSPPERQAPPIPTPSGVRENGEHSPNWQLPPGQSTSKVHASDFFCCGFDEA